jgi:hypothetical protein
MQAGAEKRLSNRTKKLEKGKDGAEDNKNA